MDNLHKWAEATATKEGFYLKRTPPTVAQRLNNPGNIIFGPLAKSHGATTYWTHPVTKHDFAIFPTVEQGWEAMMEILSNAATGKSKVYNPEMTLIDFYTKYSPIRDEKGKVIPNIGYGTFVANFIGVPPTTKIKDLLPQETMQLKHPIDKVFITQHFGERPEVYQQFGLKGHNGIDYRTRFIDSPLGRRYVTAPADGYIEEVGDQGSKGYGRYIRIRHTDGSQSVLGHLTKHYVFKGKMVKTGDRVALTGNTGFSSGPHLHWGFRNKNWDVKNGYAGYVDQEKMIV